MHNKWVMTSELKNVSCVSCSDTSCIFQPDGVFKQQGLKTQVLTSDKAEVVFFVVVCRGPFHSPARARLKLGPAFDTP